MKNIEKIESYMSGRVNSRTLFDMVLESASDIMFSSRSIEEFTLRSSKTPGIDNVPEFLEKVNNLSYDMSKFFEFEVSSWGTVDRPSISLTLYITDDSSRSHEMDETFDFDQVKIKINRYRQVSKLLDLD